MKWDFGIRIAFNKSIVDTDDLISFFTLFDEKNTHADNLEFEEEDCWFTVKMIGCHAISNVKRELKELLHQIGDNPSARYYGIQLTSLCYGEKDVDDDEDFHVAYFTSEIFGDIGTNHEIKPRFELEF